MEPRNNLYEPVINFREQRSQMQIHSVEQKELYEKAFYQDEEKAQSEYAQNTTTWD